MLTYAISAIRDDAQGSHAGVRQASLVLDTSLAGRPDAFNPVELLLAALAACMIKGVERAAPMLHFAFSGVRVELHAERQDAPPKLTTISYVLTIDTDETDRRLELLHTNVRKYGTISNTLADAVALTGTIVRGT
ncbi:OsmC family protein [Devosia sp.]|uniref:OsmC family protein n=1 Tax=Devosia sp. TaxID=1871048 RepID=UPI00292FF9C0|nr:OsmC family protein [Devosia sp.]